jgi:hypothetical protein
MIPAVVYTSDDAVHTESQPQPQPQPQPHKPSYSQWEAASAREQQQNWEQEALGDMSFSSIPSQYLPTPQRVPSHPFSISTSTSKPLPPPSQQASFVQALSFLGTNQNKAVYDARKGAFSAH